MPRVSLGTGSGCFAMRRGIGRFRAADLDVVFAVESVRRGCEYHFDLSRWPKVILTPATYTFSSVFPWKTATCHGRHNADRHRSIGSTYDHERDRHRVAGQRPENVYRCCLMAFESHPVRRVDRDPDATTNSSSWPFTMPAVRQRLDSGLDLDRITVFVGETVAASPPWSKASRWLSESHRRRLDACPTLLTRHRIRPPSSHSARH